MKKNREAHMCVNPNTCDVCNGLVTIQPADVGGESETDKSVTLQTELNPAEPSSRIISPRHCEECYRTLLTSEKVCPKCLSSKIVAEVSESDQEAVVPDKRLCCENPPITYGSFGCLLGPIGQLALQGD